LNVEAEKGAAGKMGMGGVCNGTVKKKTNLRQVALKLHGIRRGGLGGRKSRNLKRDQPSPHGGFSRGAGGRLRMRKYQDCFSFSWVAGNDDQKMGELFV